MYRKICKVLSTNSKKYYSSKSNEPINFYDKDVAYESEFYYRQDPELLKILKEKTEQEVKTMQREVRNMNEKIKEYNRDINETLRFLKSLDNNLSANDKKKS